MRPRPVTEPRLPHCRSTGWVLSSRLGCPMSSKGWSKGLGCVSSILWRFAYFSNMTSLTHGIFKSSCGVKLDTPGGVGDHAKDFWLCFLQYSFTRFTGTAPDFYAICSDRFYNCYVYQELFSIDSCDFLPSSQYNSFTLSSICFLFITMWSLQLSLWSKCIPRYFVTAAIGISKLLIVTGGHRPFLSVNVMWTNFVSTSTIMATGSPAMALVRNNNKDDKSKGLSTVQPLLTEVDHITQ